MNCNVLAVGCLCLHVYAWSAEGFYAAPGCQLVELRGYVFPRVGDALAVTHIPPYISGVLTPIPLRVYLGHG